MDNKDFINHIREIMLSLRNCKPNFHIEESVKGMFPVLKILYDEEDVTPKDIEDKLSVSSARIARVLNQLEEKKLVERTKSLNDKRKTIVVLTEEGKEIALKHRCDMYNFFDLMLKNITDEEKEEFIFLMEKMVNNIKGGNNNA